MSLFRVSMAAFLCCGAVVHCDYSSDSEMQDSTSQNPATTVVPIPEADRDPTSNTVDVIVVDKDGNMSETQYPYDAAQGGIVINNYNQVAGPGSSLFFPAFGVGLLWWGGYWIDHDGYYWNGHGYYYSGHDHWGNHWNNYWHKNWNHKWNNYRQQHPNARGARGPNNGNFNTHHGMNRPNNPPRGGAGGHGGGGGAGHGGGGGAGHGGGRGGGGGGGGRGGGGGHGGGGGGGHGR